jgi:hypothetical protein
MKNSLLSLGMICALFATCASPAFAQYYQQNGASLSQAQSPMFQAPNYWGDARVKNRSSAISNSQGQGAPPMSGGRSGGGSNAGLGMLMIGPAMMLPAMMRSTLGGRHPNHKPRGYEDDAEAKKKKKKQKKSQQYSVNEEGSLPDPLYPRQGMTPLSRTTQDMQLGGGVPRPEEQSMQVSGVVTDEGGQAAAGDF